MNPFIDNDGPDIQAQVSRRRIDWSILRNTPGIKPDMQGEFSPSRDHSAVDRLT